MTRSSPDRSLILASASPRRRDLLAAAGLTFEVDPSDVPEDVLEGEAPAQYVRRVCLDKGRAVAARHRAEGDRRTVLAADTVVVVDRSILGKAADRQEARAMLQRLSARTHQVITGFCLLFGDDGLTQQETSTDVCFRSLTDHDLSAYLDSRDWEDKAGAYAIQGGAAHMVRSIHGSYTNVVGLPVAEVVLALRAIDNGVHGR